MSVLTGFLTSSTLSSITYSGYNASISITFYSDSPLLARLLSSGLSGVVTSNLPVSTTPRQIQGSVSRCWWDDFYNRVHISPSAVNVGNLLTSKTYNIEVWSAYTTSKLLSSVTEVNTDGMALPTTTPVYFGPTEQKIYSLNVTLNGPSSISAVYTFNFPEESPSLYVLGNRSVLWPFIPQDIFEEKLQWKTDILKSKNNEQRLSLRLAPRQILSYDYLLNERQFSKAKAISSKFGSKVYGVPVWAESTYIPDNLTTGQTEIYFDTRYADYRDGGSAMLWKSDDLYEALNILQVFDDHIVLSNGLLNDWDNCLIMPCRQGRTLNGVSYSRSAVKDAKAKTEFTILDNVDLSDEGAPITYRSKPVLLDRSVVVGNLSETISETLEYFDNGSGPIEVETSSNIVNNTQTVSFIKQEKESVWNLRRWLHARRGRQKGFWLPSWNRDIVITENVLATDTRLVIENIGYFLYYGIKDIMIVLKNGTRVFSRVLSGNELPNGEELALADEVGAAFNTEDVDFICFLSYVRLDSDEITLAHDSNKTVKVSVVVKETPEE